MRYWPDASVTTDRTFSISAGLAASTLAPGSTAPEASLMTPVMAACAYTVEGKSKETNAITREPRDRWVSFSITVLLTRRRMAHLSTTTASNNTTWERPRERTWGNDAG